eukprot:TRINITY_DN569_c0_g1_i1.p1 TRINITY_DN569_c0_g1~~TRINITY_DN569_c0_g1_i1.p1  ORF type:complete len:174 (-),score=47.21 TRINITY_DN569_c0_g1_i1:112-633(-)
MDEAIQINIGTPLKNLKFLCDYDVTIKDIKEELYDKLGVPPNYQNCEFVDLTSLNSIKKEEKDKMKIIDIVNKINEKKKEKENKSEIEEELIKQREKEIEKILNLKIDFELEAGCWNECSWSWGKCCSCMCHLQNGCSCMNCDDRLGIACDDYDGIQCNCCCTPCNCRCCTIS